MGRIIKYGSQHNGKGKYHLIPEDGESSKELCGTKGVLLFTYSDIELIDGDFYEVDEFGRNRRSADPIPLWMIKAHYCKKCIKKAIYESRNKITGR